MRRVGSVGGGIFVERRPARGFSVLGSLRWTSCVCSKLQASGFGRWVTCTSITLLSKPVLLVLEICAI